MKVIKQLNRAIQQGYEKDAYVYAELRFSGGVNTWYVSKRLSPYPGVKCEAADLRAPEAFVDVNLDPVSVGDFVCRLNTSPNTFWLERREVLAVTPSAIMLAPLPESGTRATSTGKNTNVMIVQKRNKEAIFDSETHKHQLLLKYIMHVGAQDGAYYLGKSLEESEAFSDEERRTLRDLINMQR